MKMEQEHTKKQLAISSTVSLITQLSKWGGIYLFLREQGYVLEAEDLEAKSKRSLVDTDTMTMSMLIYLRHSLGQELYTVGSLAEAMDGSSYNARKAREGKIKRTLSAIAGYQIIDFYRDQHRGKRECIRIEATDLLINFIEDNFFTLAKERLK